MSAKKYRLETSAFQMQHEVTHSLVIIYLSVNSVFGLQIWPVDCVVKTLSIETELVCLAVMQLYTVLLERMHICLTRL